MTNNISSTYWRIGKSVDEFIETGGTINLMFLTVRKMDPKTFGSKGFGV
jgi:hypothetical protein